MSATRTQLQRLTASLSGSRLRRAALLGMIVSLLPVLAATAWIAWPLPAELVGPGAVPSVTLLDRHGLTLRTTRAPDGSRGGWIPLAEIDPDILRAFLAVEDERFFRHRGVDFQSVVRAIRDNLRAGKIVSGASTITMQTARLTRQLPRTWMGKARQILWALRLEAHLEKQQILELYLNRVPLGQGAVGVGAASSLYFASAASELSLGQAALLAGLAHAPSRDNPLVSSPAARRRRSMVLQRLASLGYAQAEEVLQAEQEPLLAAGRHAAFLAPHFTTRILAWAEDAGEPVIGEWRTTLDLALQTALEAEVRHTVDVLAEQRAEHAAALVLDNQDGAILAWVGSPDFWADTAGQVDMVVSRRQPGSALKPFLYGLAFDRGFTPASVLPDVPRTYPTALGVYRPRNYDRRFHGPVRAREALGSSHNVPAVELAHRVGPGALLHTLHLAGFSSLEGSASHYGLGLALGNGDVTLLELANGYRALANLGVFRPYRHRLGGGHTAAPDSMPERRVISERSAALVLDILNDPVARTPGFGLRTPFDFPFPVAAKTGTSRRFTDNWAVGVTGAYTVAVWVGNFSGRPMAALSGISGAGPLLQRAVLVTARHYAPGQLPTPAEVGAVPAEICLLSGLRASPACPHGAEWFAPGTEPDHECDWHRGGRVVLPADFAEWLEQAEHVEPGYSDPPAPILASNSELIPSGAVAPAQFRIVSPQQGDRYTLPAGVDPRYATIALRAVGGEPSQVRWWVDGEEIHATRWIPTPGPHLIRAEAPSAEWDEVRIIVEPQPPPGTRE